MNGSTLPISVQASLLGLNRSGLYYQPAPHSTEDLYIKQLIDKIYTRYPMYGYRRICWYLNEKEHYLINHKAVLRHMQEMGIQAVYPRQNTSRPEPANKIYPYLLKGLKIYLLYNEITKSCRPKWRKLHLQIGENCRSIWLVPGTV